MGRIRVLTPVFFARFFDNEMAAGAGSLKTPFFWMVAFLAAPGMFMPVIMGSVWAFVAQYYGFDKLDMIIRADKVIYLGYTACAAGVVMATAWNGLLLDRRDGLVLGSLPVEARDVIIAKTLALGGYMGLLMCAMHAGASLVFAVFIPHQHMVGILTSAGAHFIASSAYGLFICLGAVAAQGLVLLLTGGRGHAKLSPLLQLAASATALLGFFLIGDIAGATVDTLGGGPHAAGWILRTPTLWFLGLYDVILGFRNPILQTLAWRALIALAIVTIVAAVSLPLSYRRIMTAAVEQAPRHRRAGLATLFFDALVRLVSFDGPTRGVASFFLLSVFRHNRPRLPIALAIGAVIAWTLPIFGVGLAKGVPPAPTTALFGAPLAAILLLVAGFRVAASLPSELSPRWLFAVDGVPDRTSRRAIRRVVFALAVAVPTIASTAAFYRWWPTAAWPHAVLCLTTGFLIVEIAFARLQGVPCARVLQADGTNIRTWWPAYLGAFVLVSSGLPGAELALQSDPLSLWMLLAAPLVAAVAVRIAAQRIVQVPAPSDEELAPVQVLDL